MKRNPGLGKLYSLLISFSCIGAVAVAAWSVWYGGETRGAEPSPNAIAGSYKLVSVDGKTVPCTIQHGHEMKIESGSFLIGTNSDCVSRIKLAGREQAVERKASYTQEDSRLTMKWVGAGTTMGAVTGDTFAMTNEGMVFLYRK